jgi:hypothetical protein
MHDLRTTASASARLAAALATGALLLVGPGAGVAAAAACDPPVVSEVACENTKTGNLPSEWDVSGAGDSTIQGFATDISVNRGTLIQFKVDTLATAYRLDIYRIGYYGGRGARLQATVRPLQAVQSQPACAEDAETGLVDCGNWDVSASWAVPNDAVSGVYIAKLVREDGTTGSSHIPFVVRNDASTSDLLFQTSDTTWQAYNQYGGNSLYSGSPAGRAFKVSYNRPFTTREYAPEDWFFNAEYPMVRWLERNGYDISYISGLDSDRRGGDLRRHKTFLSVGHDEYWSGGQRANVEAARDAGVHLAFLSGNEIFWKTRWEPSIAGASTANRTLVCYKETHAGTKIDPLPNVWTGTWRDTRGFRPPEDGRRAENLLTGQLFTVNAGTTAIEVPARYRDQRIWRHTDIASLAAGQTATLGEGTLGYEWDEDVVPGYSRPAGLTQLSETSASGVEVLRPGDPGSTYETGSATHHLTLYQAASGALVFGAGTVQWSWGLDDAHDRGPGATDQRLQQATANQLADMGARATTLQGDLVSPNGDTPPPPPPPAPPAPPPPPPSRPGSSAQTGTPSGSTGSAANPSQDDTSEPTLPPTVGCLTLKSSSQRVRVGRRTVLTATVRRRGRGVAGVRVKLTGPGLRMTTKHTSAAGRARFTVRVRRKGPLRLRALGQAASCKAPVVLVRAR